MPLGSNSYGKSGIRLVKLARRDGRHDVQDLMVAVRFEGDFEAAHAAGDNSGVLPTDTMKNTVYALAKDRPGEEIEDFALALSDHFLRENREVSRVEISIEERVWDRIGGTAFEGSSDERRTACVSRSRAGASVESGLKDLLIMKTAQSGFSGFKRDRYTTLKETSDRILATSLTAAWTHATAAGPFADAWRAVRRTLLDAFVAHDSASVQHTLHAMGEAALANHAGLSWIRMTMPNKHHLLVDLSPFGLKNENEIFVATDEPYGLIEATVIRDGSESQR
ncbi:MAG TPA: urate oxidase [Thermoanaerobaculia bacterium]|nr:urate oxidase [Thermoanaerobaculia bacterium]